MTKQEILDAIEITERCIERAYDDFNSARNEMQEAGYEIEERKLELSNLKDELEYWEENV